MGVDNIINGAKIPYRGELDKLVQELVDLGNPTTKEIDAYLNKVVKGKEQLGNFLDPDADYLFENVSPKVLIRFMGYLNKTMVPKVKEFIDYDV